MRDEVEFEVEETEGAEESVEETKPVKKVQLRKSKKEKIDIMEPVKEADANKKDITHDSPTEADEVEELAAETEDEDDEQTFLEVLGDW